MKRTLPVVRDQSGAEIGKVTDIIPNPRNLEQEWVVIKGGRFATEHLVPVAALKESDGDYVAPFDADTLKETPAATQHTSPNEHERAAIYEYFGLKVPAA